MHSIIKCILNALICIQLLNAYEMHLFHVICIINTKQIDINRGNSEVLNFHKIRASKYKLLIFFSDNILSDMKL